jgi:hypothetical protein
MVKIDKRIVGLALVSVILSTVIMVTIARERIDSPVEILKNDYPSLLEESRKSTFSFAMVARKKVENLQFRFSVLAQKTLKYAEMIDPRKEYNVTDSPDDVLDNVVKLSWLRNETESLGIEPEKYNYTFHFQGAEMQMLLYDYSAILEGISGRGVLEVPLMFGAIIDSNGEAYYLAGESDFFFAPEENIISLSTSHNAEESNYLPDDQIWEGSNRLPLSEAPGGGVLDYESVDKDDTFAVIFTVEADSENLPEGFGSLPSPTRKPISVIQMVRVYLDGEIFDEPIYNVIQGKKR